MPELTITHGYNRDSDYLWQCPLCPRRFQRSALHSYNQEYEIHLLEHSALYVARGTFSLEPIVIKEE